jgi:hypothetical protein
MTIVCFDRAEQARYQARIEANDRRAADVDFATGHITAELMVHMLAGLNDQNAAKPVPFAVLQNDCGPWSRRTQPFAEALADMLDYDDILAALWAILQTSECPQVADLKVKIARRLADERAPDLALMECGE